MESQNNENLKLGQGVLHPGARPMQVLRDKEGCMWLCDKGVDVTRSFEKQGCWRCRDVQFTRTD